MSSRTIGLITELEVVNSVLQVTGDAPVQSLDDEYTPIFAIRQMINNISRTIQSSNYWFNTEERVSLPVDSVTNKIILPFNILRFEPEDTRYIARGLKVYDRVDRTDQITTDIVADISVQLEFNELPMAVREYIRTAARLQYNNEYFGDTNSKPDLQREFSSAKIQLDNENIENENINIFSASRVTNIAFKNRNRG